MQDNNKNTENADIVTLQTHKGTIKCLTVIGTVEGHSLSSGQTKTTKYEHVLPQLVSIEEDDEVSGLLVLLNTVGGDVEAGLAISEMIAGMSKPSVSLVLGGGHSIGIPLAVSADLSYIAPSATMTVHPMRTNGMVIGVSQSFEYMKRMQNCITDFVVEHSNITEEKYKELMLATDRIANDVGTVLFGKNAVDCGLIDYVGTLRDALDSLGELIDKKQK